MINYKLAVQCMAFFLLVSLSGCSYLFDHFGDASQQVVGLDQKKFGIVFSHNVNGETHPCGCRHYPLGGLPQVAGQIHEIQKTEQIVYIDSGDTLFPASNIPDSVEKSTTFNARELAKGLSEAGLRYWVPGDQDFAKGIEFLDKITKETKINILLANLTPNITLQHKEFIIFKNGPHKIFISGVIEPSILPTQYQKSFVSPIQALGPVIEKMKKERGYDPKDPFHRLVVVTHQGIQHDEELAKSYPSIDWIIGAHTMNFLRFPQEEGNTKLVQVLSRNHYLGHITFDLTAEKSKDSYVIHEIRDEHKDFLKPNPFTSFIDKHKEALSKIQAEEQASQGPIDPSTLRFATANSCIECHQAQGEFWRSTSHALAYQTLKTAKAENNLTCVKCHSLGLNDPKGFPNVQNILTFQKVDEEGEVSTPSPEEHTQLMTNYWSDFDQSFGKQKIESVRKLTPEKRRGLAQQWSQLDKKHNVTHNFGNVQCLNCHTKHPEHPFDSNPYNHNSAQRIIEMQDKCLTCHDPDQSPEWYQKDEKGQAGDVNYDTLNQKIKLMSCPKIKN
jgi:nitrate/TMAO reductase-like tetraheme cytochrome c subunit